MSKTYVLSFLVLMLYTTQCHHFLSYVFVTHFSVKGIPAIHLSFLICVILSILSSFLVWPMSLHHTSIRISLLSYTSLFKFTGIVLSHTTPDTSRHFAQANLTLSDIFFAYFFMADQKSQVTKAFNLTKFSRVSSLPDHSS